jgi:peptidyl-prolyl cis-trans isomerase C
VQSSIARFLLGACAAAVLAGHAAGQSTATEQQAGQQGRQGPEQPAGPAEVAGSQEDGQAAASADTVLATVAGTPITLGELIAVRQGLPEQYQQLPDEVLMSALVEQLADQILLEQAARQAGLDQSRAIKLTQQNQARAVLAEAYMERTVDERVSEAAVQQAYDAEYGSAEPVEEVRAAHILVEDQAKAQELKAELDQGADFAALAAEHGTDGTAAGGGDLGWFVHGQMVPEFADAAFAMQPGEVSAPVQSPFGWHLIRLDERRERTAPPLADVRAQIVDELTQKAQTDVLAEMRAAAEIERGAGQVPASAIRADALIGE